MDEAWRVIGPIYLVILVAFFFFVYQGIIIPKRKKREFIKEQQAIENAHYDYLDRNATIVDVNTEEYSFNKFDHGFRTIVTFSDGFKYLSMEEKYTRHLTYLRISVGPEERKAIVLKAIEAHKNALDNLYGFNPTKEDLLSGPMYCSSCGKPIEKGSRFCRYCGHQVS